MGNSIEGDIFEGLSCPVCFKIPEAEVYECENGHWLCRCYFQMNPPLCPECRSRLDRDRPRRCRAVERILEGLKVDCVFKSNGCNKKLSRGSAQGHQTECTFNFDKFGEFVNPCKGIGYPNCGFKFNNGNTKKTVEHFVSEHGCILTTSEKFQMELTSFKESAKARGSGLHFWTPIIADLKEQKCYLLTMTVLKVNACFNWLSIFLPYPKSVHRESSPVEVEYSVKTMNSLPFTVWIGRPISLKKASKILPNQIAFVNYSLPFVQGCSKEGSLLIDCNIRQHGVAVSKERKQIPRFVCTRRTNSISAVDNIQLQKPNVTVQFNRAGGSSAAKNSRDKLNIDCDSNVNTLLPSMRNLFEGEKPTGLTNDDVEWLKTDLIFITARHGNMGALKYLIGKGVNFNIIDEGGRSPIHYTMWDEDQKIGLEKAKLLVRSGIADVCVLDAQKSSVIHYATWKGSSEAVEYFLQKGCDVNAQNIFGWTPLQNAVYYCSEEEGLKIAKSLVENGADISIKNIYGENALDIATNKRETKIVQLLRSHQPST